MYTTEENKNGVKTGYVRGSEHVEANLKSLENFISSLNQLFVFYFKLPHVHTVCVCVVLVRLIR